MPDSPGRPRLVIVKTGSTVPSVLARRGDFEQWIGEGMGLGPERLDVVSVFQGQSLPEPSPERVAGVVITGSPAFVSEREPWSVASEKWVARAVDASLPVLGICYGHQLLAQAFGGRVGPNPRGRSIGTVRVHLGPASACGDRLLGDLVGDPSGEVWLQVSHVESVLSLPEGATLLAASTSDPHHAFSIGRCAWGVQFHPEFDADIVRGYIRERADDLRAESIDPDACAKAVRETPHGPAVLRRFAELVRAAEAARV